MTAAQDCRIDAIVPEIAWHSLTTSLDKAGTSKSGWSNLLYSLASPAHLDPHMTSAYQDSLATGTISAADYRWFAGKGPANLVKKIRAPTLIIQGTVDNLFTLDEGVTNFKAIQASGVPVHMVWFCDGHGICLTNPGDPNYATNATMAWLNRWVKRDPSVNTGPAVDIIDQNGVRYRGFDVPPPIRALIPRPGKGHAPIGGDRRFGTGDGAFDQLGSGGCAGRFHHAGEGGQRGQRDHRQWVPGLAGGGGATRDADLPRDGAARSRAARVFAQIVDGSTGLVLGNQVTPIDVTLDGRSHTTSVPLEIVSQAVAPGQHVVLQLVATTVAYAQPRLGGSVTFSAINVTLPVVSGLKP